MDDTQNNPSLVWLRSVLNCHADLDIVDRNEIVLNLMQHARLHREQVSEENTCDGEGPIEPIVAATSELGSSAYILCYPGRLAALSGIRPAAADFQSPKVFEDTASLLRGLISDRLGEIDLFQAVLFPATLLPETLEWYRRCYAAAGLEQLATLGQFELNVDPSSRVCSPPAESYFDSARDEPEQITLPNGSVLQLVPWDEALTNRLCAVVEQTYQGTLDVPKLNGYRDVTDTLRSYLGTSPNAEPLWWLVQWNSEPIDTIAKSLGALGQEDRDCGCLFISIHNDTTAEVVYLGIRPEYRGRGIGRALMKRLTSFAAGIGINRILLAVDLKNEPAIEIYREIGFQQVGLAEAWFLGKR